MDSAADWLVDNANVLDIKQPNVQERERAVGFGQYTRPLGLTDKPAAHGLGNSYDKDAAQKRAEAGL
eukprot:15463883-Alexandrium_andersonii.AAC.1